MLQLSTLGSVCLKIVLVSELGPNYMNMMQITNATENSQYSDTILINRPIASVHKVLGLLIEKVSTLTSVE